MESYLSRLPMASSMHLILHTSRRENEPGLPACFGADNYDRSIDQSADPEIRNRARTFRFAEVIDFATAPHYEFNYRLGTANDARRCSLAADRVVINRDVAVPVSRRSILSFRRVVSFFPFIRRNGRENAERGNVKFTGT